MVWYAAQTFYCREEHVASFLEGKGCTCFIPMCYDEQDTHEGKRNVFWCRRSTISYSFKKRLRIMN